MARTVTTPPTEEPVTLERALRHLKLDGSVEDDDVKDWIVTAREHIEDITEHALMPQEWTETLNTLPAAGVELRGGNVRSVGSIAYLDDDGQPQTIPPEAYEIDVSERTPRLVRAPGHHWPTGRRFKICYQVGYVNADVIPRPLISAVLLVLADLAENRGAKVVGVSFEDNPALSGLIFSYTRIRP